MALRSLLQTKGVLELCGAELVLPSVAPVTEEDAGGAEKVSQQARRNLRALQSRFSTKDSEAAHFGRALAQLGAPTPGAAGSSSWPSDGLPEAPHATLGPRVGGAVSWFAGASGTPGAFGSGSSGIRSSAPTLDILEESLLVVSTLLARWAREAPDGNVSAVAQAVEKCARLTQSLPRLSALPEDKSSHPKLASFLSDLVAQIKALPAGGLIIVPAGWLRARASPADAEPDDGGHCLLLVLVRNLTSDDFSVAVVNAGEGLQYHPVRHSGEAPCPERPVRQCPLVLANVPRSRATCGVFWYLLYRQLVHPLPSNGPQLLYGSLLPAMNRRPLAANFGHEPPGWVEFRPTPVAGDGSFVLCLLRAVSFCLRALGSPVESAAWSSVVIRRFVAEAVSEALVAPLGRAPGVGELAVASSAAVSLARTSAEHVDRFGQTGREGELQGLQSLVAKLQANTASLAAAERDARSVQPPVCEPEVVAGPRSVRELRFGGFERLLAVDVEPLKGEVDPPRILISVPTSEMPLAVRDPFEASDCCRLANHLLTLLANQAEHLPQSALARFSLIARLMTQLLPMPLPVHHPHKAARCFWMQEMKQETKADLMRHLYLIARHFAAVCFTLRDALLRRPLTGPLHGSLASLHYAGLAEGPTAAFGIDPGMFRESSETLLLVAPEYQALRSLVLDYFDSIRQQLRADHVIFAFDQEMSCSEGDFAFVEQIGLCLGLDGARREAPLLLSGERPELLELFPELAWFRDVVFLWKMLLLPACDCPAQRNWRLSDSLLTWRWERERFEVRGFGAKLSPELASGARTSRGFLHGVLRWFDQYQSENKTLSQADPSVLAGPGCDVKTEDDVLFLKQLPSFNGALGPADSELLLTYLTAPYLRIPLLLGFFTDRHRVSLLREPQLQAVLDAAMFEPGPWQSPRAASAPAPEAVPAADRRHLSTPVGLLFNELMRSPKPVLEAMLCLLRVAVEKDVGRPDSSNSGLILYIVRLAVRVESYLLFLIQHGRRGAYPDRSGASYEAAVRGLAGRQDDALLSELEEAHEKLRRDLQAEVLRMLMGWLRHASVRREKLLSSACRTHAHIALLFKNVPPEQLGVRDVAGFLSAQVFLNLNHRWSEDPVLVASSGTAAARTDGSGPRLGAGEVELFDAFESRRSSMASWLRENAQSAGLVLQRVEQAVTSTASGTTSEAMGRHDDWVELARQPGDFSPQKQVPLASWFVPARGEEFRSWLLRATQGPPGVGGRQVSVNLGQYGAKREGLELLPVWAVHCADYLEAYGRTDAHCVEREISTKRVWKELVGHEGYSLQRWVPDDRGLESDAHAAGWLEGIVYRPEDLASDEAWLQQVLEPVRTAVPQLAALELRRSRDKVPSEAVAEVWLAAVATGHDRSDRLVRQLKELRVQRQPPVVEIYDVTEHGRQFYRTQVFSSDTAWSFHAPATGELLVQSSTGASWSLAAGDPGVVAEPSHSILVLRTTSEMHGKQLHMPQRFLRGLIPDSLLEQYSFWRCERVQPTTGIIGRLVGEERHVKDEPTRLYVLIEREAGQAAASVQRRALRPPSNASQRIPSAELWEEDSSKPPEILVNLRRGPARLTQLLARLENLSHILAWASADGSGGIRRVELPRLRLSFKQVDGRLHCDQHRGFWLSDTHCSKRVERLLAQWGGGTVLLENASGELHILVSALSEPVRPADGPSVDGFLPIQAVHRRGDEAWVSNLAEGSRHYYYPVHLSGSFAFAPTAASGLYLLLCRFFTWHFAEAAAMAATVSEISTCEEQQLWDRLNLLAAAPHHPDAVACCLSLALATAPYRKGPAASLTHGWSTGQILLEYVRKRHLLSADCGLSLEQELQVIDLQRDLATGGSKAASPLLLAAEVAARRAALQELLGCSQRHKGGVVVLGADAERCELPVQLGVYLECGGFDRVCDKSFTEEAGLLERISATLRDVTYARPESQSLKGKEALAFLDSLFSTFGTSAGAFAPFPLLYEVFTKTISVEVVDGDDSSSVASALLRVCSPDATKSAGQSVLRALEQNPQVCDQMPKWGSSELTWSFGVGNFKFDKQSTSKLLEAAGSKLRGLERSLSWPSNFPRLPRAPTVVTVGFAEGDFLRYWAPPLTCDFRCGSRVLGAALGKEFGGRPLETLAARYVLEDKAKSSSGPGVMAVRTVLESLLKSPSAASGSTQTIERLLGELKVPLESGERCHLGAVSKLEAKVNLLAKELDSQRAQDSQAVEASVQAAEDLANRGGASDWLRRAGGQLPRLGFCALVAALMSEEPGTSLALREVNSSLTAEDVPRLMEQVASALFYTLRVGQVARVQRAVEELREERRSSGGQELALSLRAQAAASQLGAARHFLRVSASGTRQVSYDPRLLVFEFLSNIMLRKSQVSLVEAFSSKARAGQSVCQQMIMGEGKTTVIAPLLVLLLADGERLVCACTPVALLDMSRAVMAERFSSPVLPRPVLTFVFQRQVVATPVLLGKLQAARRGRAAVLAVPASVKSVLLRRLELLLELSDMQRARRTRTQSESEDAQATWLKFPSWLSTSSSNVAGGSFVGDCHEHGQDERCKAEEIRICGDVLGMFHNGIMLLDEVDLLLDPLRSELNWPLGRRSPLDLTNVPGSHRLSHGLRYALPFHLLDAVFAAASGLAEVSSCGARREAQAALGALAEKIKKGRQELKLQVTPHLVVISREFYMEELMPHLADWTAIFLEEHLEGCLVDSDLRAVLKDASCHLDARVRQVLRGAPAQSLKLLNLAMSWLHNMLPYVLSKVHRVSYGLLTGHALELACRDKATPLSRLLLAVPFVGKDTPSASSEFSHPDVTIGFTVLAYRLQGLRERDAMTLLKVLLEEMRAETSAKYHRRAACKAYVAMVTGAGGTVRGFTEDGRWIGDLKDEESRRRSDSSMSSMPMLGAAGRDVEDRRRDVWPLELLDLSDPEQTGLVFEVLRHSPRAIQFLLDHHAFVAGTLDRNESQLTASGQELAGPQLFGQCLGFSGTPNDLLPQPMGRCVYAAGDDGKVLTALSCTQTVSVCEMGAWSPTSLLDIVAKSRSADGTKPKYHALIDSGALVTGKTNQEVAEYLLRGGLEGLDGVLFLNERDERVVLERETFRTVDVAQSGLGVEQRFTFYDHVHTTGMDVKQPLLCTACMTLSKDMTFRDYAQGAYRMRGIGRGQRIELLLTPEVSALMHKSLSRVEGVSSQARAASMAAGKMKHEAWSQRYLVDIIAWLLLNGLSSEAQKRQLLRQQDLRNIWRSAACQCLEAAPEEVNTWLDRARTKTALAELVVAMDFSVSTNLPGEGTESLAQRMRKEAEEHVGKGQLGQSVWAGEAARDKAREEAEAILSEFAASTPSVTNSDAVEVDFALCGEQVQEQEQEQEEEAEEDHEQHVELEEELDKVPEAALELSYERDSEEAVPWPLRNLFAQPASSTGLPLGLPFYPLADFAVNRGILNESCPPLAGLPGFALLSDNYYRRSWRLTSVRRLKSVICFMEWVPNVEHLKRLTVAPGALSEQQRASLREAFELCGGGRADSTSGLGVNEVVSLCRALDLGPEGEVFAAGLASGGRVSLSKLESEVATQAICKMQQGRFFVALSLEEAEHLRASMHLMKSGSSWPASCGLALRCVAGKESALDDSLLDLCGPVLESAELGYQLEAVEQMLRFLNSAEDFQAREMNVLLRSMQLTRLQDRLPWWSDVRACRRRSHRPWQRLPVAKVFLRTDEFEDWATKALLLRFRWALAAQRLWPLDIFRMMDSTNSGVIQRKDLQAGLDRLGVRSPGSSPTRWAQQVDNLFALIDTDHREVVYLEDFRAALEEIQVKADWEVQLGLATNQPQGTSSFARAALPPPPTAGGGYNSAKAEPPNRPSPKKPDTGQASRHRQPQLAPDVPAFSDLASAASGGASSKARMGATSAAAAAAAAAATPLRSARLPLELSASRFLAPEMCSKLAAGRFKLKWQRHTMFRPLWTSSPTESPLSVWAPEELIPRGKFLGIQRGSNSVKERVALGHYATTSFSGPAAVSLLEVTDQQHSGFFAKHPRDDLHRFMEVFFPHPVRFRQIWRQQQSSSKPLYVWEPVPPSAEYVAAGLVATTDNEAPPLQDVRCVPRLWTDGPAARETLQVWAGAGADGSPASVWSNSSSSSLLRVTTGAAAQVAPEAHFLSPEKKFYIAFP